MFHLGCMHPLPVKTVVVFHVWPGCPQQPGKPQSNIDGKFAVVRWTKATVSAGDPPIMLYIVQAKELSTSMSFCVFQVCCQCQLSERVKQKF